MNPRLSTNAGRVVAPSGHPQAGAAYGHPTAWGRTETDHETDRPAWRPEELFEPMEARPFTHDRLDWCRIRHGIIRSAVEMQGAWLDARGRLRAEAEAAMLEHLEAFWRDGVGSRGWRQFGRESAADTRAWSAAFVSWVVRNAGVPAGMGFDFSGRHMTYIAGALRNRMRGDGHRPFWFYGIGEQAQHRILPGDILCRNRRFQGHMTTHSLESLRRRFWGQHGENANVEPTGASHCDVATGYVTQNDRRYLEVIGGNTSHVTGPRANTVGTHHFEVDAQGRLVNPAAHHIFGFVVLTECVREM